ncbi:hypothetical protein [Blastococcus sp. CCUG 61487]|uniref:hypothetical protein n=1 Tax=Blastococcus sp. CCUG 61487 TaxID=1840703 RepID=UPI0010C022AE|nr:hypothetical protein [Blastococcus sp. CCUG 61487]TKJ25261.1 hypothetical protein A6V29_04365 [Blastococcus sp. CCUG 61487]
MTAGFGTLGVVRVQVAGTWLATVPMPTADAKAYAHRLRNDVAAAKNYPTLVEFDASDGGPCWIRGRNVSVIDVVSTEDPGA